METQTLSLDIISSLPENIIETILSLMPIRDALRTSILSKRWKHCWMTMPKLVFDDNLVQEFFVGGRLVKYKLVNAIFHVLLMHSGPMILEFILSINKLGMVAEFDHIILYISRKFNVEGLRVSTSGSFYKLPTSFFSLKGLDVLPLSGCYFEPPMQVDYEEEYVEENSFNFVKLFQCVPLVSTLALSKNYMKFFSSGGIPSKLSTLLHLTYICLDVCLREQDVISFVLCIIRSSPNLERIFFQMDDNEKLPIQESCLQFADLQDDLSLTLDHLKSFKIVGLSTMEFGMEFVKLIMARSTVLKIARIELNDDVSVDKELKILRDMIRFPFPRASPSAQLIIERPETTSRRLRFWRY
ncbi:F-box/FBD/LRR-repeat protein At1g13570-like [Rutidosis leptorrhynchoides]|uniref:F-box/FBD/LRR-repeat protein At1g13570-like n=1 Tax=Rutidosis leptorrhynchoides TaxID=125765 RepID=UPI003A995BD3